MNRSVAVRSGSRRWPPAPLHVFTRRMGLTTRTPGTPELGRVGDVLADWQHDHGPLHLHPGDLGWHSTRGADATAAALRLWCRDDALVAIGLLDGPDLLRLAVDPRARDDAELVDRLAADLDDPAAGVLGPGGATVEARGVPRLAALLTARGWRDDEPWTPFRRDLAAPVDVPDVPVTHVDPHDGGTWTATHWSAFRGTPPTPDEHRRLAQRWSTMATGPWAARLRGLTLTDGRGAAVAVAAVWSAGPGRPGLLEPMGVHPDHRGHGYGRAVVLAAAQALRGWGASSLVVCAESSNGAALATYAAAGLTAGTPVTDLRRP